MRKLTLRFLLAVTVLGNTGGFLKDLTAVAALAGQNLVNTALTDVRIAFAAQTGIHKHFMDIAQTGRLPVNVIFAVTAAVVPAGDHDLVSIIGQRTVRIIQRQRCFRKTNRCALLGAAEDHILHFGAAKSLGALLAHDPKDRIGDIGFTGAVGTHDGSDIISEADNGLIRKGFESLHFQTF